MYRRKEEPISSHLRDRRADRSIDRSARSDRAPTAARRRRKRPRRCALAPPPLRGVAAAPFDRSRTRERLATRLPRRVGDHGLYEDEAQPAPHAREPTNPQRRHARPPRTRGRVAVRRRQFGRARVWRVVYSRAVVVSSAIAAAAVVTFRRRAESDDAPPVRRRARTRPRAVRTPRCPSARRAGASSSDASAHRPHAALSSHTPRRPAAARS